MDTSDFIHDAAQSAGIADFMVNGGSEFNGYSLALGLLLTTACKRLEMTDKDEINRSVMRAMHALGFEAHDEPRYLREGKENQG